MNKDEIIQKLEAENARMRGVLQEIHFVLTKGTAKIWPKEAINVAASAAKDALEEEE